MTFALADKHMSVMQCGSEEGGKISASIPLEKSNFCVVFHLLFHIFNSRAFLGHVREIFESWVWAKEMRAGNVPRVEKKSV